MDAVVTVTSVAFAKALVDKPIRMLQYSRASGSFIYAYAVRVLRHFKTTAMWEASVKSKGGLTWAWVSCYRVGFMGRWE